MSASKELQFGFVQLFSGKLEDAQTVFQRIWRSSASIKDRYVALTGMGAVLDRKSQWHTSETVVSDGLCQLRREAADNRRNRNVLIGIGVGILGALLLTKRRR